MSQTLGRGELANVAPPYGGGWSTGSKTIPKNYKDFLQLKGKLV